MPPAESSQTGGGKVQERRRSPMDEDLSRLQAAQQQKIRGMEEDIDRLTASLGETVSVHVVSRRSSALAGRQQSAL